MTAGRPGCCSAIYATVAPVGAADTVFCDDDNPRRASILTLFPPTRAEAEGPSSEWNPQIPPIRTDRKSTRLNSSHDQISYAVFCLKKKKNRDEALDGVLWARHVDSKPRV